MKILVVDDEPSNREVTQLFLESRHHEVALAANSEEALEILEGSEGFSFEVLLTDRDMPPGDPGEELIRCAKRIRPDIRAILMSGHGDMEDVGRRAGADAFLSRPFGSEELEDAIRNV